MNLALLAISGWGKSFRAQAAIEQNMSEYARTVVLDFCDEFRGLVKADLADWFVAGPTESGWSSGQWSTLLEQNRQIVIARHRLEPEEWRDVCARIIKAARNFGDILIVVDEAHFVAPQKGKIPAATKGLATTGRGEQASGMWISQRPAEVEETVLTQCQARLLGGLNGSDLDKASRIIEYNEDVHNPENRTVSGLPAELEPEDRDKPQSLQLHKEGGSVVGSEWIYSDNTGDRERQDSRGLAGEMKSTHYGAEGKDIEI